MYKLTRWSPQDRSGKVSWLLNELNVPFEVQELDYAVHHQDPEYRKANPMGWVPTLYDLRQDFTVFETGAICLYLAEQHQALIPKTGSAQYAKCMQWMMYNYATLEPAFDNYWSIAEDDPEIEKKKSAADEKLRPLLQPVENVLKSQRYLAGDEFSIADIAIGQSLHWLRRRTLLAEFPNLTRYLTELKQRPAAIKAALFADQQP